MVGIHFILNSKLMYKAHSLYRLIKLMSFDSYVFEYSLLIYLNIDENLMILSIREYSRNERFNVSC